MQRVELFIIKGGWGSGCAAAVIILCKQRQVIGR